MTKLSFLLATFLMFSIHFLGYSADFFWIGGTGNWSDVNNWSNATGGPVAATLPTNTDNVIFDNNSGLGSAADIVTMDVAVVVNDFDFSAVPNAFTISSALASIEIQGSLFANGLANITWTGIIQMNPSAGGNTLSSNGQSWNNTFEFNGVTPITITDDLLTAQDIYVNDGGIIATSVNVSILNFYSNTTNVRTITITNSTFDVNGSNWDINGTSLTFTALPSSIELINAGTNIFTGGGVVYDTLRSSSSVLEMFDDNTFTLIDLVPSSQWILDNSSAQQVDSLIANGSCGSRFIITTPTPAASASIEKTGYPIFNTNSLSIDNVDAIVSSGQSYLIGLSDISSSNGWTLSGTKFYWVANGGKWNDTDHWSFNSGSGPAGCIPGPADTVIFDGASFGIANDTVYIDSSSFFGYMDWSQSTNNPTLKLDSSLHAYGDFIFNTPMRVFSSTSQWIEVHKTSNVYSDDVLVECDIVVNMNIETDSLILQQDLNIKNLNGILLLRGEVHTNSDTLSSGYIAVVDLPTIDQKKIELSSSAVFLSNGFSANGVTGDFVFDAGTSHVTIGDPNNQNYLTTGMASMDFWDLTLDFSNLANQTVSGTNFSHNKLEIIKGSRVVFDAFSAHSINDSLIMIGTCVDSIYISSNGALPASFNALASTAVEAECIGFNGVAAGGVPLTAIYSEDLGGTNTNWTIDSSPPVTTNFTADGPFCFNDITEFTDLSIPQAGVTSFTQYWLFDDGSPVYNDLTQDSTSHVFSNGGDFDVSLISEASNFCTDTATVLVHINKPNVYLTSSDWDLIICEGETVTLEAYSGTSNVDFEFFLNGNSLNLPSPNDTLYVTDSIVDQDSISVVTYENGCPTLNPQSAVFTVLDAPNFSWVSNDIDTTICFSDSIAFNASSLEPSIQYRFLLNGLVETMYSSSGFYWNNTLVDQDIVSVVAQNANSCRDTLDMQFTVYPLPATTLDDDVAGSVICENELVTFTANGAATYEFFKNGVSQFGPSPTNVWSTSSLTTGDLVTVTGYTVENCQLEAPETFAYTVTSLPNVGLTISDPDTSICSGTLVTITGSGASLYELVINGMSQGAASPTNSYNLTSINDNDEIYFKGTFGSCSNNSDTVIFEVFDSPTTTLVCDDIDQIICFEDLINFTSTGADSYEFFINGVSQGGASGIGTFSTSSLLNNQTVSVEGISNGCVVNQELTFTVLPIPAVSLFSDDPNNVICEGEAITFTSANAQTYQLFINGISQGAAQTSPVFSPTLPVGNVNVYTIGTSSNGCSDTSVVLSVTVNPTPNVVVTSSDPNNEICEGELVVFTGSGSDMYQFFVDGIPQGIMSVTDTFATTNLLNGQSFTAIGSSLGCVSNSNTITTNVYPIPDVDLTSTDINNIFCQDEIIIFTASGATNYEFFVDGVSQGPASLTDNINSTGFSLGTYDIEVIGESNSCVDTSFITVTVNGLPSAGILSSNGSNIICSGDTVTYTGTGGALYEFFVDGNTQGPVSPVDSINLFNLSNGNVVSVIVSDVNGCSVTETMLPITVNPTPNVVLTSSDPNNEICIGENVSFFGSGSDEYEFFVNAISQGPSSPANSFSTSGLNNGDIISLIGTTSGCVGTATNLVFAVYNFPTITLTNNAPDLELCTGELTDLIANGGTTYQFLVNGVPTGAFSATSTFTGTLSNGDVVTVIGELNGCQSPGSASYQYVINTYPTINSGVNPGTTVCIDEMVSFTALGASTYDFDVNGSVLQSGASSTFDISTLSDGDVVNITGYNGDCPSTPDSYTITVESMNLDLTMTPSSMICEGDNITFTATGGDQYLFYVNGNPQGVMGPGNTLSSSALSDQDIVTFSAYSNSTGCTQDYSDFTTIQVLSSPVITALSSLEFCEGDSVILVSNGTYGNQWYIDGNPIPGATDTFYVVYDSGTYGLEVTAGGDGNVWSFGHNNYGNLGDGTTLNSPDPVMANTNEMFDELSSGDHFVMGVTLSGEVFAWGDNEFGQLGDGTYTDELVPQQVPTLVSIKTIAASSESSMAVTNSGELYVWGNNDEGQLATGNTSVINFPFLNSGVANVDSVAAGKHHFVILKTDGTVWTVGNNDHGQLGTGNLSGSFTAVQVPGLVNIAGIGAGAYHSFAIDSNGDLYVWGNNGSGQLGLGDIANRLNPTLSPQKNVTSAIGGLSHSLFLTSDKTAFAAGNNDYGQLGNGTMTASLIPEEIDVAGAVQVAAGDYTSIIRRTDNTVFVHGNNFENQLSSQSGATVLDPEFVSDLEGVTFVDGSGSSSHFIFGQSQTCVASAVIATELAAPPVSIIIDGDTLIASETGISYQWYQNGIAVPSGTNQSYVATIAANYYVEVTYANGCVATSPVYEANIGLVELESFELSYYPNPFDNEINIKFNTLIGDEINVSLLDQTGRLIGQYMYGPTQHIVVNLSNLAPGIYYLKVKSGGQETVLKTLKR